MRHCADAVLSGIAETVCVMISSSALGRWVDGAPTRLRPLLLTIFSNRITLVVCCVLWIILFFSTDETLKKVMFAAILALGMVEKSSRMANVLCMERDWVPTLANANDEGYSLTHMNTAMRRIDIACKILAPLAISEVVVLLSTMPAALAIAIVSSVTLVLETWSAMRVWKTNSRLRAPKGHPADTPAHQPESPTTRPDHIQLLSQLPTKNEPALAPAHAIIRDHVQGVYYYFGTTVWLPSLCVAVLHGSVLAWSGTLITWLLNAKFTLNEVTIAKGVGSLSEIGSTLVFPWAVAVLTKPEAAASATTSYQMVERRSLDDDDEIDAQQAQTSPHQIPGEDAQDSELIGSRSLHVGVVKVAQGALTSLLLFLIPTVIMLFFLNSRLSSSNSDPGDPATSPLAAYTVFAILFFTFLSLSFLGRWTYDLAVTQLTQMLIPATHRSSFGGVEQAIVSGVSLIHWVAAATWHRQEDFVWLALGSFCAIAVVAGAFTWWARWWTRIAVMHAE